MSQVGETVRALQVVDLRVGGQLAGMAVVARYELLWPGFRREATTDWLQPLEDGMRSIGRPELGTLVLAVVHVVAPAAPPGGRAAHSRYWSHDPGGCVRP
jgi:hypothetical protein